ncbi:glutathione peroxidase [Clostridium sartagoforme AAU1]|uniref:Glutathione peroxidase n=1 Tax=Clostridium sartagoforme AAU1 TaxID=1202534 RepID=R9C6D5_9CLOT|nr:glutathione peroxidase [Clostridium sartagoforme]EOR24857.1 glutathione peroxidase [Clostridium sartagoforme AAU1]
MNFYDINAKDINGKEINMSDYKGKVVLVVNTASKCGFTPQYADLEILHKEYKASGLEILGFPCNQFLEQEPGSNTDVKTFCELNYGVTFKLFEKINVKGISAHPIFKFLCSQKPFEGFDLSKPNGKLLNSILSEQFPESLLDDSIKWNFTKFLVDKEGNVVGRFESTVEPLEMIDDIKKLL